MKTMDVLVVEKLCNNTGPVMKIVLTTAVVENKSVSILQHSWVGAARMRYQVEKRQC